MYNSQDQENRPMAIAGAEPATAAIPAATTEEAMRALDYTCRYYLKLSAVEFLERLDSGKISGEEVERSTNLQNVLDMVAMVRC